jgi:hypothetical protein
MKTESFLGSTEKMESIADIVRQCEQRGFPERFIASRNELYAPSVHKFYEPEKVKIVNTYRYEGLTDPDDYAVVYSLVCNDGVKGTVVDAYGVYANGIFAQLQKQV